MGDETERVMMLRRIQELRRGLLSDLKITIQRARQLEQQKIETRMIRATMDDARALLNGLKMAERRYRVYHCQQRHIDGRYATDGPEAKSERITLRVTPDQHERIQAAAKKAGQTISAYILSAVDYGDSR